MWISDDTLTCQNTKSKPAMFKLILEIPLQLCSIISGIVVMSQVFLFNTSMGKVQYII